MQLCWRGTFIDVVDSFEQPTRRSRSLSPQKSPGATNEEFIHEKEYVEFISMSTKKIEPLPIKYGIPAVVGPKLTSQSLLKLQGDNRISSANFLSASTTASSVPFVGAQEANLFDDLESEYEADDAEKDEDVTSVGTGSTEALIPPPPVYCNTGSLGHPELCMKPCLFFSVGKCDSVTCGYCHYDHDKRPMHLDKRNRAHLKDLSLADCMELLIPILQERANLIGMNASKFFVTLMSSHVGGLTGSTNRKRSSSLVKALRSMSFRTIVTVLTSRPDAPPGWGSEVVQDMLNELRIP